MSEKKAIVIGAGVAGLAVATRLALQHFHVTVYEKNDFPGGKLSHFSADGFQFDAGPSLFTQPENIEALFELANEPMETYFSYEKLPVTCHYFYENGKMVTAYADREAFAAELHAKTGEEPAKVITYLQASEELYNKVGELFVNHSLHRRKHLIKAPLLKAVLATRLTYVFKTLHQLNTSHFSSNEAVQLFDRFATYNGSDPYQAPGMLSLIPNLELNQGTFYPKGGMKSITEALYRLALKKGVTFHFNTLVERIINVEGQVKGVVIGNENVYAPVVVSNMDVYFTYDKLLRQPVKTGKLLRQERSSSAIVFYWGIAKTFPELHLHNIFFSNNYQQEFTQIFSSKTIGDDPTIYVNITSKMEASHAPAGHENWFVMVNAPANKDQDWPALIAKTRQAVIGKLNRILNTDIEPLIVTEHTLDPIKLEAQTLAYAGAIYGSSSNAKMAAFKRHPNYSSNIKGLYFAGGTVHPGGGIPLCLKSAKLVAELVAMDSKTLFHQGH